MRLDVSLSKIAICLLSLVLFAGCPATDKETAGTDTHSDGHDHGAHGEDDGHDHSAHTFGPNGGHFFDIDGLDLECEWSHDDEYSNVRVHFLDSDHKEAFVDAPNVILISEGRETVEYELIPEMSPNEDGKYSVYVKKSAPLLGAMSAGVRVKVTIDGKEYEGEIKPHIH